MLLNFIKTKKFSVNTNKLLSIRNMLDKTWDLSKRFPVSANDINSHAIDTFNLFFKRLNTIITKILKTVVSLAELSPNLFRFSKDFKSKAGKLEQGMVDIARSTKAITQRIEKIADNSKQVSEDTIGIETEVKEAHKLGLDSVKTFGLIKSGMEGLVRTATVLNEHSKTIGSITAILNNISDETNILSLNARIEAARNSSDSKGFKIIAEEISSLAKQSKTATLNIQNRLDLLTAKIDETVQEVNTVEHHVKVGEKMISMANKSLSNVHVHIGHLSKNMGQIEQSMTLQSNDAKEISTDINLIENTVKLQSDEVENIFSAAQQIHSLCDNMVLDTGIFHLSGHQKAKSIAEEMSNSTEILSFDKESQERAFKQYTDRYNFIELAYLTDETGVQTIQNIYSAKVKNRTALDKGYKNNWSDKEWFQFPKQNQSAFISNIYRSSATHEFCFTVSFRCSNAANSPVFWALI